MFQVALSNGRMQEIEADRITFDEGLVWFWSHGMAITSHPASDIESLSAMHVEGAANDEGLENAVERTRERHPRAFEAWTDAEDERLRHAHATGLTRVQLSEMFERQPSAIRSRLDALGLAEMPDDADE
jgi:hypothetical protein